LVFPLLGNDPAVREAAQERGDAKRDEVQPLPASTFKSEACSDHSLFLSLEVEQWPAQGC